MGIRVGVIGAGAWGTALGHLMATQDCEVVIWAYEPEVVEEINQRHENQTYFPGVDLPDNFRATSQLAECLEGRELVFCVAPSHAVRSVMTQAAPHLPEGVPIISASKGIENQTLMTMSEVLEDVLPIVFHPMLAFLSGPTFAREVAQNSPSLASVAARFERVAEDVQQKVSSLTFRLYTSTDVVGVELGGALKNVIAIAAGAADGLGLGTNTIAALITRGLAEITRLAVKKGANPLTLAGLSGMGDLVLTCTGPLSRNRTVGVRLGRGESLASILKEMSAVAEGVKTAQAAHDLAQREGVEMPITSEVRAILVEGRDPREALWSLMQRGPKPEEWS